MSNQPAPINSLPEVNISKEDLENLDTEKLSKVMMQSIYVIEASLFSQAHVENSRIMELRDFIKDIETELKNEDLTPDQKIKLYKMVSDNLTASMGFLNKLHTSISEGMESIGKIESSREKTKKKDSKRKQTDNTQDTGKEEILSAIQHKIREKALRGSSK